MVADWKAEQERLTSAPDPVQTVAQGGAPEHRTVEPVNATTAVPEPSPVKSSRDSAAHAIISGQCEHCPACGLWEGHGAEPWCFHEAYFLGRSAKPVLAAECREKCPLGS
jgi:hypothetical protein